MAILSSNFHSKKLLLFLNISFLFLLSLFLKSSVFPHQSIQLNSLLPRRELVADGCAGLHDYSDYKSQCTYVKSQVGCEPKGYINYLRIFYCTCGQFPILGHFLLLLWLLVLFYLMGDTAANYFCSSLESLSRILKLPPTIAGITLLSLGNGASDVFASIVSFTRSNDGDVGLNSILGGAFFISSVVVGVISIFTSPQEISVDKHSFIRDALFFLSALLALVLILLIGKISLLGAILFVSIYFVYISAVSGSYFYQKRKERNMNHLFDVPRSTFFVNSEDEFAERGIPLLGYVDDEKPILIEIKNSSLQNQHHHEHDLSFSYYFLKLLNVLELPLYLPRRLTIPVVSEEKWSKTYAVISVTLAPLLLAAIYNTQREKHTGSRISLVTFMAAGVIAVILGNLAYVTTKNSSPPKNCLLPWLAGGFLMSVTWTYITAEELVSLLVSIGNILGISPSVLGLTVLAWGNSLGDLISNVAMAMNGGADGAQIAITGCYAGPMFNTLVGLGMSLVFSSASEYPAAYQIPKDPSLYETLAFLIGGLLWALVILPRKSMRLDRSLGCGLLAIYSCFLSLRVARALGILKLH
ncbi:cation/calcium exchanger 1-like [Pistacia vera]|uniref:cation/calcium exchanger 1-like n=1 Tax=Pistacia vera TaxID=55513 RepID=UPI001262EF68|nr:cation/calcium exchanger 1-like [Pistacia vera]